MNYSEQEVLKLLTKLVNIDSSYDKNSVTPLMPYGKGVCDAFKVIEEYAKQFHLYFQNYDNRVCEIIFGNLAAKRSIGVLAHIDVVPINDWEEGFNLKIENDLVYGRGVCDDKGPLVVSLLALIDFATSHQDLLEGRDFNIKLIIGGDEERGSSCLDHYFKTLKKPDLVCGFTPDAEFPVVYGEKGMLGLHLEGEYIIPSLQSININNATNVVPSKITFTFFKSEVILNKLRNYPYHDITFEYQEHESYLDFTVFGKSAHASISESGRNAIHRALRLINYLSPTVLVTRLLEVFPNELGVHFDPLEKDAGELGPLSCNLGRLLYKDNQLSLDIDIRFNENTKYYQFIEYIEINAYPLKMSVGRIDQPLIMDKNSPFINALVSSYREVYRDMTTPPLTKGGGTYAKHAKNVVAFGPEVSGFDNHIHEDYEVIKLSELEKLYRVYYLAIKKLVEIENAR